MLKNVESLSLTMVIGIPCNLITSFTNTAAIDLAVYGCLMGIKCPYLLSLSTTTSIVSNPCDLGNFTTKSILMSSHTALGMGKGCKRPLGEDAKYLCCWHTRQPAT
ncbi:hypothetical protein VIGAN_11141900 [Vigna angularis var. angularis]|uniref:Uncharacterized protein n=1 Tax=Vigna angularis var. angularis TaxID=157739 RepID=A0A0S3TAS4_PHAAN|nr:hypothetical protein VIGAN_11141900 [Vigna angularis var. angularis]